MKQSVRFFFIFLFLVLHSLNSVASEINREAPNCNLEVLNNKQTIDLNSFKGQVIYVDFWASWCGPCAKSFPFMNALNKDLKKLGLLVIGVNMDENVDEAKQFLENYPASFTIVSDPDKQCAKGFDVKAMPSSYLVDRTGVIRYSHLGYRQGEAEEFRVLVEQLLVEKNK